MDWKTFQRQDLLKIEFSGYHNPVAQGPDQLVAIVDAFSAAGLAAEEIANGARKKYTADRLREALSHPPADGRLTVRLSRRTDPAFTIELIAFPPSSAVGLVVRAEVVLAHFADRARGDERVEALVSAVRRLAEVAQTRFGMAHPESDAALGATPPSVFQRAQIYDIFWLNLYGADLVDQARVQTTPAHRIEQLSDGAVLLLTGASPVDYASETAREAQARALAHLRDDVRYADALARLRARSARLVQVERQWDPDVAPLLELIVDNGGYANRGPNTERFNQYRPPQVNEHRADTQPADVPDVDAAVDEYHGVYAEQLIALLHDKVPEVLEQNAAALTAIDFHLLQYRYPESFPRHDIEQSLLPAVGGYLGKVMVRELGGRWVPRGTLDETQVVIGDTAFLPFLRARHYLLSTQSLLDHSLTQFYRVAAREAGAGEGSTR